MARMKHIAVVGACYIDVGIEEFDAWSEMMLRDFGPAIEPLLPELFAHAQGIALMFARLKAKD